MASYIDNEFAIRFFSYQRNFKQVSLSPIRLSCSCPVCGDSATDKYKARFWYYIHKDVPFVHCFNCDYSMGFGKFLEEQDEVLYREYLIEKRKEETFGRKIPEPVEISEKINSKLIVIEQMKFCERLDKLPQNHPIIKYVKSRCIPENAYKRLYFTKQWQELVNETKHTYDDPKPECRLVIPFYNSSNKIEAYQGRALSANARQKYMTIKAHEDSSKIYGMDTVDDSLPFVYFMEGPIDSLFIPNALAIAGGSLSLDKVPYADKRIWVLDDEPRHTDTIKRMNKLIEAGEKVLFWDECPQRDKDINEKIKSGATPESLKDYIDNNWECGIMAQLRMTKYCKI